MFSGIVQGVAEVAEARFANGILQYSVNLPEEWRVGLKVGASVAINGVCQTVVHMDRAGVCFDAIDETLRRTTLGSLKVGERVNVERSLRYGDEVGGHLLSGHVYGTGAVGSIKQEGGSVAMRINCSSDWTKYLFEKGFIAVDGVSLTVGEVDPSGSFLVHLIPETLRTTTLSQKQEGSPVNLEFDSQTLTIVHTLEKISSS